VRVALLVADRFFPGSPARAAALSRDDADAEALADEIAADVLARTPDGHSVHASTLHLRSRERRRDRVAYAINALTTPTGGDWSSVSLPRSMAGLYRVIRPVRLLRRYIHRVARRS
jgi:hypothetical protein